MNDRRIEQLLKMSVEIDAIEAEAEGRPVRSPAVESGSGVIARIGWAGTLAAAACIGAVGAVGAWGLWSEISGAKSMIVGLGTEAPERSVLATRAEQGPTAPIAVSSAGGPEHGGVREVALKTPSAHLAGAQAECGLMLVIVHDLRGMSRCVRVRHEDWHGRCATDLLSWELAAARPAVAEVCAMVPSRQTLVLALSGPSEALPSTESRAEQVAQCILDTPRTCDAEGSCFQSAAANCLPPDVSFKVETVALR